MGWQCHPQTNREMEKDFEQFTPRERKGIQALHQPRKVRNFGKMVEPTDISRKCRKWRKSSRTYGLWDSLPIDVLISVIMQLDFLDFIAFGGVCRSWKSVATAHKSYFMAHQHPVVLAKSNLSKKACFLYKIHDAKRCKLLLPDLTNRSLLGLSSGYLIMFRNVCDIVLVNILTRHEIQFPILHRFVKHIVPSHVRPLLYYSTMLSNFVLLVVNRNMGSIMLTMPISRGWIISYAEKARAIVDLTIFDGKIYFLTDNANIGELILSPKPHLNLFDVKINLPKLPSSTMQLVTFGKRLFMVIFLCRFPRIDFAIYELDDTRMEWMKIDDLGELSLFLSDVMSASMVDPTIWGGRSNCMYVILSKLSRFCVFPVNGSRRPEDTEVVKIPDPLMVPHLWLFPHQCYDKVTRI